MVAPFVALLLALFLSAPIAYGLYTAGVRSEAVGPVVFLALLLITVPGVAVWGWRDYRRRAGIAVELHRDRVSVSVGKARHDLAFADIQAVRLVDAGRDLACILERRSGKPLRLPAEVAPYSLVQAPLEATLIAGLVRDLGEQLRAGQAVSVHQSIAGALLRLVHGCCNVLLSILMILSLRYARLGLGVFRHGRLLVQQGWLGMGGGFIMDERGLSPPSGWTSEEVPWDSLELTRNDDAGLSLRSEDGRNFAASPLAVNYWPASKWIVSRLATTHSRSGGLLPVAPPGT